MVFEVALNRQVIWIEARGKSPTHHSGSLANNIFNQVGHPQLLPERFLKTYKQFYISNYRDKSTNNSFVIANLYSLGLWGTQTS